MNTPTYQQVAEKVQEATALYAEVSGEIVDRQAAASIIGTAAVLADRLTPETFLRLGIPAQDALLDAATSAEAFGVLHESRLARRAGIASDDYEKDEGGNDEKNVTSTSQEEHDNPNAYHVVIGHIVAPESTETEEGDDPYNYRVFVYDQLHALDSAISYNRNDLMDNEAVRNPEVARKVRDSVLLAGNAIQAVLTDPVLKSIDLKVDPEYLLGRAEFGLEYSQQEQRRQARAAAIA